MGEGLIKGLITVRALCLAPSLKTGFGLFKLVFRLGMLHSTFTVIKQLNAFGNTDLLYIFKNVYMMAFKDLIMLACMVHL